MVKVLTLEEGPGQGVIRWRLNLSTKLAPAHPDERITLEQQGESSVSHTSEQPITARGSEVAAGIQTESTAVDPARLEARIQARELLRRHSVDLSHLDEYTERILANGLEQTTEEIEDDLTMLDYLKKVARTDKRRATASSGRGLCDTCAKSDVCPVALDPYYAESLELADDDKPDKLKHMQLVYGRRPLLKCSSYLQQPYEGAAS
jgi:hypothetical protein